MLAAVTFSAAVSATGTARADAFDSVRVELEDVAERSRALHELVGEPSEQLERPKLEMKSTLRFLDHLLGIVERWFGRR